MARQISLDTTGERGPRLLYLATLAQIEAAWHYQQARNIRATGDYKYFDYHMERGAAEAASSRILMGIE